MGDINYYAAVHADDQGVGNEMVTMLAGDDEEEDLAALSDYVRSLGWKRLKIFAMRSEVGSGSEPGPDGRDTFRYHNGRRVAEECG